MFVFSLGDRNNLLVFMYFAFLAFLAFLHMLETCFGCQVLEFREIQSVSFFFRHIF
jgi:hypothetical protein